MPQPEARIVRDILRALNALDGVHAVKSHGSKFSLAGEPDIHGSCMGRAFAIEVKTPGGKPTSLQLFRLDAWAKAGARVGIAYSVADALMIARGE